MKINSKFSVTGIKKEKDTFYIENGGMVVLRTDDIPINAVKFCNDCKHKMPRGKCAAFPGGIPFDVLVGERDHNHPIDGDNGIVFEPIKNKPPRVEFRRSRNNATEE